MLGGVEPPVWLQEEEYCKHEDKIKDKCSNSNVQQRESHEVLPDHAEIIKMIIQHFSPNCYTIYYSTGYESYMND